MHAGQMESAMMGGPGPSQQTMGQIPPGGPNSQPPMVNGTQMMQQMGGPRHPAVSNAQMQAQGMMPPQSPGLMNQVYCEWFFI